LWEGFDMTVSGLTATPVVQPSLSHNVLDALRTMISKGQLQQGEHLKEAEIAAALGVSRGPVREALSQLANEGFVELRRHRGAFVVELTRADIIEVYTLRLALERLAVERAAERMTPELFAEMDAILDRMKAVGDGYEAAAATQLDLEFHDLLYKAADHRRLENSWEHIRSQVEFFLNAHNESFRDFLQVGYLEHAELRDVLAKGDAKLAGTAIQEHLDGAYNRLLATHPQDPPSSTESGAGTGTMRRSTP